MTTRRIRRRGRWVLLRIGLLLYFIIGLFILIWLRTAIVNLEYELGELNTQKVTLLRENKLLTAQRASFYSAMKIEDIAIKRLGMNIPERENIFYVKRTREAGAYMVSMPESERASRERLLWR